MHTDLIGQPVRNLYLDSQGRYHGVVLDVLPSGTAGLDDADGVLVIRLDWGQVVTDRACYWVGE